MDRLSFGVRSPAEVTPTNLPSIRPYYTFSGQAKALEDGGFDVRINEPWSGDDGFMCVCRRFTLRF